MITVNGEFYFRNCFKIENITFEGIHYKTKSVLTGSYLLLAENRIVLGDALLQMT